MGWIITRVIGFVVVWAFCAVPFLLLGGKQDMSMLASFPFAVLAFIFLLRWDHKAGQRRSS